MTEYQANMPDIRKAAERLEQDILASHRVEVTGDFRTRAEIERALKETGDPQPPSTTTGVDYAEAYAMGGSPEAANAEAQRIKQARQKIEQAQAEAPQDAIPGPDTPRSEIEYEPLEVVWRPEN